MYADQENSSRRRRQKNYDDPNEPITRRDHYSHAVVTVIATLTHKVIEMSAESNINQIFKVFNQQYTLKRYPETHQPELRAWDTADLYLLNTIAPLLSHIEQLCILNDNFGALTIPLATHQPLCYGDSWLSRQAIKLNGYLNQVSIPDYVDHIDHLISHHPKPTCVIARIPKQNSQLIYVLQKLNRWLPAHTAILMAGMDKHLSRGQYQLLAKYFGPSQYLPGVKKARIWTAQCDKSLTTIPEKKSSMTEFGLTLDTLPNVFSRNKLDIGSRFFIENLDQIPCREDVADMGCGNGVLGLAYLKKYPQTRLTFCDESFQAIASTKANLKHNCPLAQAQVYADDGLKQVPRNALDLVLCNPPFHHLHTVSTDLAYSMFKDAFLALKPGGELWIVANRHLGYHIGLKRIFKHCVTKAANKKFTILCAMKQSSYIQ